MTDNSSAAAGPLSDNMRGSFLMVVAMAAFTFNDACMKALSTDLPLFQAIFLRGVLTVAGLALIAVWTGGIRLRMPAQDGRMLGWRSFAEVGSTVTFLTALQHMPLANLSAIMQSLPLAVTLAAAVFLRSPIGWRRLVAIGVGFLGVMLIVRPGTDGFDRWAVLGIVSVALVVVRDLTTRQLSADVPSSSVALLAAVSVTVMAGLAMPFEGWQPVTPAAAAKIAGAGAFLIAGYLTIIMATRVGDVGIVAPFRYTALVVALVVGWFAFGQWPDGWTLAGAGIVIATGIYTFHRERSLARG